MSNTSSDPDNKKKNSSSGQGALGMGGDPSDDPRDLAGGGDGRSIDDSADPQPVPGAFGSTAGAQGDAVGAESQAVGPAGDSAALEDVKAALHQSKTTESA